MAMRGQLQSSGSRGRSYVLMLLLAFGIAMFGVMVIHKLRERRILSLLLKDKDRQLISFQLLLQKEREYGREAKSKIEDMKAKMHTLQSQKMELNGRILEMQSIISSLRDEQRTIELAFEEKQNEIKQLRERSAETNHESNQANAISEMLRQKEAKIEDLKHQLELQARVWSVSTDDPANPTINSTAKASIMSSDEAKVNQDNKESVTTAELSAEVGKNSTFNADISRNESANYRIGDSEIQGDDGRGNDQVIVDRIELTGEEQSTKLGGPREGSVRGQHKDQANGEISTQGSENADTYGNQDKKNNGYDSDAIHKEEELEKPGDDHRKVHATGNKQVETTEDDHHQGSEDVDNQGHYKGAMKMEIPENLHGGGYAFRGKHGHMRKIRGKRLRLTTKTRESKENAKVDALAGTSNTIIVKSRSDPEKDSRLRDEESTLNLKYEPELSADLRKNNSASADHIAIDQDHDKLVNSLKLETNKQEVPQHGKGITHLHENRANNDSRNRRDRAPGTNFLIQGKLEDDDDSNPEVTKIIKNPKAELIQPNEESAEIHEGDDKTGQAELDQKGKDLETPEMENVQEAEKESGTSTNSNSISEDNGKEFQEQNKENES